jgi:hypothetical protein
MLLSLSLATLAGACTPPPPVVSPNTRGEDAVRALTVQADELASLDPDLRASILADVHQYTRFVARRFVGLQCDVAAGGPTVNLHGDAHLEQYLVTSLGRGLGDFDESTVGPVEIDLVRLAGSIRIASRMRGWDARALWGRFLEGYLRALRDPTIEAPEPAFVRRAQAAFLGDHDRLLAQCDALIEPLDEQRAAEIEVALTPYFESIRARRPELDPRAFELVAVGPHRLGVGSRGATNLLFRARGATDDAADDIVFEAKAVTQNPDAWCLPLARRRDPLRVLVADARLAYVAFRDVGAVEIDGRPYWLHEWVDDYTELSLSDDRLDQREVAEVLFDVGVQLGLGHPRGVGAPYEQELRQQLSSYVVAHGDEVWRTSEWLTEAVWSAWQAVRRREGAD